jgi:hypothetical protein
MSSNGACANEDDKLSVCERGEEAKSDANLEPKEGVKMKMK